MEYKLLSLAQNQLPSSCGYLGQENITELDLMFVHQTKPWNIPKDKLYLYENNDLGLEKNRIPKPSRFIVNVDLRSPGPEFFQACMDAGVRLFSIDLQFGDDAEKLNAINLVRAAAHEYNSARNTCLSFGLIAEITGREIRTGLLHNRRKQVVLNENDVIIVTSDRRWSCKGSKYAIYANCSEYIACLREGQKIFIGDACNIIGLRILRTCNKSFECRVFKTGQLKSNQLVTLPFCKLSHKSLTLEEAEDLAFARDAGFQIVAVRGPYCGEYHDSLMKILNDWNRPVRVLATISIASYPYQYQWEKYVTTFEGILLENVSPPLKDREITMTKFCFENNKPIFWKPRSTLEDVEKTHMLNDANISILQEASGTFRDELIRSTIDRPTNAISRSIAYCIGQERIAAIIMYSRSGISAEKMSRLRPRCPIVLVTESRHACETMLLFTSIYPVLFSEEHPPEHRRHAEKVETMLQFGVAQAIQTGLARQHDKLVLRYRSGKELGFQDVCRMIELS